MHLNEATPKHAIHEVTIPNSSPFINLKNTTEVAIFLGVNQNGPLKLLTSSMEQDRRVSKFSKGPPGVPSGAY